MVPGFGVSAECQSIGTIGKEQRAVERSRGLVVQPQKLSVGAYFELLFLGCGFLIQLSNRYDSPRFRAPWKKICQKYDIQQEPSLFKDHPFSCQYGDALCSMVPTYGLCKKLDFPFLSLGGRIHGARVWCLSQVPKPRNHWQEVEGSGKKQRACYLAPKTLSWCIF